MYIYSKNFLGHRLASIRIISVAVTIRFLRIIKSKSTQLAHVLERTESGCVEKLEWLSDYIGISIYIYIIIMFTKKYIYNNYDIIFLSFFFILLLLLLLFFKDGSECPKMCKLAYEYVKGNEGIDAITCRICVWKILYICPISTHIFR